MTWRQRDLLQSAVVLCIALTPAWLLPSWLMLPWVVGTLVLVGPLLWLTWSHGPFVPTPRDDVARIVAAMVQSSGERFVDLGSGDGRMLLAIHQATGASGLGIEGAPALWLWSWLRTLRVQGVQVRLGDLRKADLSQVDAVYVWGTPYLVGTEAFGDWLRAGLRPGARVVTYGEPLVGWVEETVDGSGVRAVHRYVAGS